MTEPAVSAIIIPFPKRHRAINPVVPVTAAPLLATPASLSTAQPLTAKATAPRPLNVEPKISGLPAAPLSRVIADLDAALTRQNAAVARWRTAIADLRAAIDGLDGSLKQYRDRTSPSSSKGASAS
jgi:hypothetical protein